MKAQGLDESEPTYARLMAILRMQGRLRESAQQQAAQLTLLGQRAQQAGNPLFAAPQPQPALAAVQNLFAAPAARPPQPQPAQPLPAPPPAPDAGFTPDQLQALQVQIAAYRYMARSAPLPPVLQKALFEPGSVKLEELDLAAPGEVEQPMTPASDTERAVVRQQARQVVADLEDQKRQAASAANPSPAPAGGMQALGKLFPQVRVTRESNPYLLLRRRMTTAEHAAVAHKVLIPSITPTGIDVAALAEERERFARARIINRIGELESLPGSRPEEHSEAEAGEAPEGGASGSAKPRSPANLKALIELKALRLLDKQKRLREDIVQGLTKATALATAVERSSYRRMKKHSIRDIRGTEKMERSQRVERERKEKLRQHEFIASITNHGKELLNAHRTRQVRQAKLNQIVSKLHTKIEKEELARLETLSKERLRALREDDEEAYLKLVQESKNTRIVHILGQTTEFLKNLTNQVIAQQETVGEGGGVPPLDVDVDEDDDEEEEMARNKDYYGVAHKVKEEINAQPEMLQGGELKEYQLKGLQWMVSLYNNRLNGILADEMGLGKTIQTISLLTYLYEKKKQAGPFLIIVPLSTVTNWSMELEKWAPDLKKIVFKGTPQQRREMTYSLKSGDFNVLLTTYEYIIRERPVLSKIKWVHMIIDEGHRMKNANSKLVTTLTQYYTSRYRLILTGTPLQNNLPELWALLNFICPKIFASVKTFDEWFNSPFATAAGQEKLELNEEEQLLIIKRLHKVLRPFLLRRLKKDVESELPDKVETVVKCKMSALQQRLYDQIRKHGFLPMVSEKDKGPKGGVRGLNNTVMHLRKVCNHPYVFGEVEENVNVASKLNLHIFRASGKFELLDRILPKLFRSGHKVLIFFQMTLVMDLFEDYLRWRKHTWLRLDGSNTADARQDMLTKFNAPDSPYNLFILSTRAGGLGLNLQVADTVIIFDSDWNPHQDLQAQDRAHRIGQKNEVRILRLITSRSIEENILQRAQFKLDMDGKVIQAGKFDNKSSAEEREAFLRALIEGADDEVDEENADEPELNDEELNEVIARSDWERELFRQIDQERIQQDAVDWLEAGVDVRTSGPQERLMQDDELPDIYRREHLREDIDELFDTGRGQRIRKDVTYDDGMTEEQFVNAVEKGELAVKQQKAQARLRRKVKRGGKPADAGSDSGHDDEDDHASQSQQPSEDDVSSVGTRGRKRPRSTRESTDGEEKLTKKQRKQLSGHLNGQDPMAVTDNLRPDLRAKFNAVMEDVLRAIEDLTVPESDGSQRRRAEAFWSLPARKDWADYYREIKNPISLEMIRTRVRYPFYSDIRQFKKDLDTMCENACTYNEEGSEVYSDAVAIRNLVNAKFANLGLVKPSVDPNALRFNDRPTVVIPQTYSYPNLHLNMDTRLSPLTAQALGGQSLGGQILGGQLLSGHALGGAALGGQTLGGQTLGGQALGGQAMGGQALGMQALGAQALNGQAVGQPSQYGPADYGYASLFSTFLTDGNGANGRM
ncbi:SNF2 family N-terminal domain-containing protein [Hyaloraphidium curvatum]|nr:SNF2 family N-terminal domain-containing protein [Hyaloraphidium curvatum]